MNSPAKTITVAGRALRQRLALGLKRYEVTLGPVPEWTDELDASDALRLIESACRIGMRLPATDLLQVEEMLRSFAARQPLRPRRPGRPSA